MNAQQGIRHDTMIETATRRRAAGLLGAGLAAAAVLAGACGGGSSSDPGSIPQPSRAQLAASGLAKLPVASEGDRVDVAAPTFSNPTDVTNPLFPISDLQSAILNGRVEGEPFHTETTLLPQTRTIESPSGKPVETLVSQYTAFLGGRIEEVALDFYAQADDGSVWYFGEDVFNYNRDGVIADTEGTWLAGKEGPAAMIMPADPQVGDVNRPENIPGLVFEEVRVKTVDKTVDGPGGPVDGAMVGEELHDDGTFSDKVFAPGYGEFYSAHQGDVEALALAVPTDALPEPPPRELRALERGAAQAFDAVQARDWKTASARADELGAAWLALRGGEIPPRLIPPMGRALVALDAAIADRDRAGAGTAAIDVAQATLDIELSYRPPTEVDLARFELWTQQVLVDAEAGDLARVSGDVSTLEWVRDRFADTVQSTGLTRIDTRLAALREGVVDEDMGAVADEAASLRHTLAGIAR
jgi:hypothetical protein